MLHLGDSLWPECHVRYAVYIDKYLFHLGSAKEKFTSTSLAGPFPLNLNFLRLKVVPPVIIPSTTSNCSGNSPETPLMFSVALAVKEPSSFLVAPLIKTVEIRCL